MEAGSLWGHRACRLIGVGWEAWVPAEALSIFSVPVRGTCSLEVGTQSGFR